jgi:hypothetical protein
MVKVHFLKSHTVSGWLIRLFTFSQWNHTAIEIDGQVYEARGLTGVARSSAKGYLRGWAKFATVEVDAPWPGLAVKFLDAQVGKGYDFGAVIALPFREPWQSKSRWFCSEIVAAALVAARCTKMRIQAHRVTPRDLWARL